MKTLLPKMLFVVLLLCLITQSAQSACSASFTKSITDRTVTFTNTSTTTSGFPNMMTYLWSFGDGTYSTLKNPVKTYTSSGLLIVTLMINDSFGCTKTAIDTLFFQPDTTCTASFTKSISDHTVSFTNTSTTASGFPNMMTYYWDFGDGNYSLQKNPVHTYPSFGTKIVTLTINDSFGCTTMAVDTLHLGSDSLCKASFTKSISGLTVSFTNTSVNATGTVTGIAYYWDFGIDGGSVQKDPIKVYSTPGFKTVTLTTFDSAAACYSNYTDSFTLAPNDSSCDASFFAMVNGSTVSLTNTSTNTIGTADGLMYSWYFSDGTLSTDKEPTKIFLTGGLKTITLTILDTITGCSSTETNFVTLDSINCAASFTKTITGLTVAFTNTSISSNGTSDLYYTWDFGDGTGSNLENPTKTFATGGMKVVWLSIYDSSTICSAMYVDTFVLATAPLCEASFSLAMDTTTPFLFYILNTSVIRPTSAFFWDFGDGTTSSLMTPTHTYSSFGTYYVCLTVFDPICTSTYCDTIGMDSTGRLLKTGAFGFKTLDYTTQSTLTGMNPANEITQNMQIHPNPTSGEFTINFTSETIMEGTIQIADITGKTLQTSMLNTSIGDNIKTIDISSLKPSIYFVHVTTATGYKVFKIVKQ